MKKVLIIANQFPPMGGSGVQRSVKFVKNLRYFDYEPVVLTRTVGNMPVKDETLMKDIPEGVKIYRTKAFEAPELKGALRIPGKVLGKVTVPDSAYFWYMASRKKALKIIEEEGIDIVYSTSAPYSDHLLGLYIKKKTGLKWVVDFRDEWTNNPYTLDAPYNPVRTRVEKGMEHRVVTAADRIIANSSVMRANFIKNNGLSGDNFYVIPNGYDKEDFDDLDLTPPKNHKFTLVYTGALYGRRKPDVFFEALSQLIKENKIDRELIRVQLIGNYHKDKLQAQIDSFGLGGVVEIVGYVPHDECIRKQLSADSLLLIEGGGRGADAFYTGKVFEYMNTGRPVLSLLPEGVAKDLVLKSGIGLVSETSDVEGAKRNLLIYYKDWKKGSLSFKGNRKVIDKYERRVLTGRLARIFDK
ncbi:MAG: glycosyltransferase family 4 protein [Clostridiales bacterium]|nr:glycosyltransferase family 4 protein [Clostridiales bacterium]